MTRCKYTQSGKQLFPKNANREGLILKQKGNQMYVIWDGLVSTQIYHKKFITTAKPDYSVLMTQIANLAVEPKDIVTGFVVALSDLYLLLEKK